LKRLHSANAEEHSVRASKDERLKNKYRSVKCINLLHFLRNSKTPRTVINKKWCELADEKKMIAQKKLDNLDSEAIRQQEIHSLKMKQMIELHELTMKNLKEEHLIKLKIMLDNSSNKCNCKKN
jgi:hypothetical protein